VTLFGILAAASLLVYVLGFIAFAGNGDGGQTATAGTVIQYLVPPNKGGLTRLTTVAYTSAGTAHTLTFQRTLGRCLCASVVAAAGTVITLNKDPGAAANSYGGLNNPIAANDFLAVRETDGIARLYKVLSVAGLAITLTAGLAVGVNASSDVWHFGITTDVDGRSGKAHPAFAPPVSVTTSYVDRDGGVVATYALDEPILISSNNLVAAGTFAQISWAYSIS